MIGWQFFNPEDRSTWYVSCTIWGDVNHDVYAYRTPTKIKLKKGVNHILVKCPIKTFIGKDWQNPVKWMFTFVESPPY